MALQFQPPSFVQPLKYEGLNNLSGGIDELYNTYLRQKAFQQQQQLQGLQIQGARADLAQRRIAMGGLDPSTLTDADYAAAMRPEGAPSSTAAPAPQSGFPSAGPMGPQSSPAAPASQLSNPAAAEAPENPHIAPLRAFLQMRGKTMALDMLEKVAGLNKTQAEAQKAGAEAGLTQKQVDMLGGSDAIVGHFVNQIKSGKMTADDLSNLGRGDLSNSIKVSVMNRLAAEGVDTNSIKNSQAQQRQISTSVGDVKGGMTQKVGALAGTLEDVLNRAEPLVGKLNTSKIRLLNDAFIAGKSAVNDPDVNEVLPLLNSAKGLYASVISNGGSALKEDKEMASENIGRGLNPAAFAGMKRAVLFESNSRVKRLGGAGYNEPPPKSEPPPAASYKSAEDVRAAVQSGKLPRAEGIGLLRTQFGYK